MVFGFKSTKNGSAKRRAVAAVMGFALLGPLPAGADDTVQAVLGDATVSLSLGASGQRAGDTSMLNFSSNPGANITETVETFDGNVDGARIGLSVDTISIAGQNFGFNLSYDRMTGSQSAECAASATQLCTLSNLFDTAGADQTLDSNPGATSSSYTSRKVQETTIGAEWQSDSLAAMRTQDKEGFAAGYRLGFQYQLQRSDTRFNGSVVRASADYAEALDTHYFHGTAGLDMQYGFAGKWRVGGSATVGLGGARTDYYGSYTAQSGTVAIYNYTQELSQRTVEPSAFGSLGLELGRSFGAVDVSLFSDARWSSYQPVMRYNNNDVDDGSGTRDGTRIRDDSAFSYAVGIDVSIDLF